MTMTRQEALRLLELTAPFTADQLDKAYHQALTLWHPSSFAEDAALLAEAMEQTLLIDEAHSLLAKEAPPEEPPPAPSPAPAPGTAPRLRLPQPVPMPEEPATKGEALPALIVLPPMTATLAAGVDAAPSAPRVAGGTPTRARLRLPEAGEPFPGEEPPADGAGAGRSGGWRHPWLLWPGLAAGVALLILGPTGVHQGLRSPSNARAPSAATGTAGGSRPQNAGGGLLDTAAQQAVAMTQTLSDAAPSPPAVAEPPDNTSGAEHLAVLVRRYREAAERGDPSAQRELGKAYRDGRGVARNLPESARWFRKAAEQGDDESRRLLRDGEEIGK